MAVASQRACDEGTEIGQSRAGLDATSGGAKQQQISHLNKKLSWEISNTRRMPNTSSLTTGRRATTCFDRRPMSVRPDRVSGCETTLR
jgi:hypothetical protein